MKRNCNGCKALLQDSQTSHRCTLGKKIAPSKTLYGLVVAYKPLEGCPKPMTHVEFVLCEKYLRRSE